MRKAQFYTELKGENGLIIAIIWQAVKDLEKKHYRESAIQFFKSPLYKDYLSILGLPSDFQPVALNTAVAGD